MGSCTCYSLEVNNYDVRMTQFVEGTCVYGSSDVESDDCCVWKPWVTYMYLHVSLVILRSFPNGTQAVTGCLVYHSNPGN